MAVIPLLLCLLFQQTSAFLQGGFVRHNSLLQRISPSNSFLPPRKIFSTATASPVTNDKVVISSLGAPSSKPKDGSFESKCGVRVDFTTEPVADPAAAVQEIVQAIDNTHGKFNNSVHFYS